MIMRESLMPGGSYRVMMLCTGGWCLSVCGCITASLATDTGISKVGGWSTADVQYANVGETVRFSLVLREGYREGRLSLVGIADYAVLSIAGERLEAGVSDNSFEFEYQLAGVEAGRTLTVTADAYLLRGRKDFMKIGDTWHRTESPYNSPDRHVAGDSIRLRIYQSNIDAEFQAPHTALDWMSARLVIRTRDNRVTTILPETPQRDGFVVTGPDDRRHYHIYYEPAARDINKTLKTTATLFVLDVNGQQHTFTFEFDTP